MKNKGFTLMELLIASSILAAAGLAVAATFAGGINAYNHVRNVTQNEADIMLGLEKMERDIRNTPLLSAIIFLGDKNKVSFAGFVPYDAGGAAGKPGRITYYKEGSGGYLVREEADYPEATSEKPLREGRRQDLAAVNEVKFSYFYRDEEKKEFSWKEKWNDASEGSEEDPEKDKKNPLGVKVEISFEDDDGEARVARTIFIPTST